MNIAVAIPARYGSTRFPGKPLALIAGRSMLERVLHVAQEATRSYENADIFVTTEDQRIADHAAEIGVACIRTSADCATGSDRALAAVKQLDTLPDFVINLQGDAPFTPPAIIRDMIESFVQNPRLEIITPVQRLSWSDLDRLRDTKKQTPFSGTTAVTDQNGKALWFSKNILPAIRGEESLRSIEPLSPVLQHIGLYGFRYDVLERFCTLPYGFYEQLEGLEQLRMLENGIQIQTIPASFPDGTIQSGIDSPEDIERAELYIQTHGDPIGTES